MLMRSVAVWFWWVFHFCHTWHIASYERYNGNGKDRDPQKNNTIRWGWNCTWFNGLDLTVFSVREEIPQVFQHLVFLSLNLPEHADSFYLKLKIKSVLQADQREVIKALAEIANCEDHCCGHLFRPLKTPLLQIQNPQSKIPARHRSRSGEAGGQNLRIVPIRLHQGL